METISLNKNLEEIKMNVLSLFNGHSGAMLALERAGVKVDNYFSSEIDKYAMKVSAANYDNIIELGDINNWREWNLPKIDLILGGSPCQGFSFAGKQLNFEDERSKLFFEFENVLKFYKPDNFLLENVKMKKESMDVISERLNVEPILINSSLVSAQNRERLYWTSIKGATQPKDKGILISDILEDGLCVAARRGRYIVDGVRQDAKMKTKGLTKQYIEFRHDGKSNCLTTVAKDNVVVNELRKERVLDSEIEYRYLTPLEYERLQTVPEGFTACVSDHQRKKMLGNGWTIDVIAHILKDLK